MKLFTLRRLVDKYSIEQLKQAEFEIIQEKDLNIELDGDDQSDMLSTVITAVWIREDIQNRGVGFREALGEYSKKMRVSIEA